MAIEKSYPTQSVITPEKVEEDIIELTEDIEDDGSIIIEIEEDFYTNLVTSLTEEEQADIVTQVQSEYEVNKSSIDAFFATLQKGLDLLGLDGLNESSSLFDGACTAHHPLILESAIKYQSKHLRELFPPNGAVKTQIIGEKTEDRLEKANRIKEHMNYQINNQIPGYIEEKEHLLLYTALVGTAISKAYYDDVRKSICAHFVPVDQFIAPFFTRTIEQCDSYTHVIYKTSVDFEKDVASGLYYVEDETLLSPSKIERSSMQQRMATVTGYGTGNDSEEGYTLLEHYTYLDIEEEFKPYIVTIDSFSGVLLGVRRNWRENDETYTRKEWFTKFDYVPGFYFYSFGLLHLLGSIQLSLTTVLRSLVDSGQFANMQGGFKLKGLKFSATAQSGPIAPGEFRDVEGAYQDIQKAFFPLPFKEPSQVLYNMLQFLESRGQKFADSTDQIISEATNYGPVGTTVALLDAASKFQTALTQRLHRAQAKEYKIFYRINSEYLPEEYPYDVVGGERTIYRSDYDGSVDVLPVSDPNAQSQAQRAAIAQAKMSILQYAGDKINAVPLIRELLMNLDPQSDVDAIAPKPQEAKQADPVTDIMMASQGLPIKAFTGQDHDSHMQVKVAFLQDPMFGQNPFAQKLVPILQANIQEHLILKYQEQMGMQPNEAAMVVQAQKLTQQNQMMAKMQQYAQDPALLLAQAEQKKAMNEEEKIKGDQIVSLLDLMIKNKKVMLDAVKASVDVDEKEKDRMAKMTEMQFSEGLDFLKQSLVNRQKVTQEKKS